MIDGSIYDLGLRRDISKHRPAELRLSESSDAANMRSLLEVAVMTLAAWRRSLHFVLTGPESSLFTAQIYLQRRLKRVVCLIRTSQQRFTSMLRDFHYRQAGRNNINRNLLSTIEQ